MRRMLGAMAIALFVIGFGLGLYADVADREQGIASTVASLRGGSDDGTGGTPWRTAGVVAIGGAVVLGIGALAAPKDRS
jgi:hypothetical protein